MTWNPAHRIEFSIKDSTSNDEGRQSLNEKFSGTIQSTMKPLSCGKPFMELLSQENISDHFLTPKIFKSMKFVGHCSSVIKSFRSNFASIILTIEKSYTPETEVFQETIYLGLSFHVRCYVLFNQLF